MFLGMLAEHLKAEYADYEEKIKMLNIDAWVYGKGKCPDQLDFHSEKLADAESLLQEFIDLKGVKPPKNVLRYEKYLPILKSVFA